MRRSVMEAARSEWAQVELPTGAGALLAPGTEAYQRHVGDGHLSVLVCRESLGWHLSISHRTNSHHPRPGRYPRWDEIEEARERFVPDSITRGMVLPPSGEFVNLHPTTFHLWELPEGFGA